MIAKKETWWRCTRCGKSVHNHDTTRISDARRCGKASKGARGAARRHLWERAGGPPWARASLVAGRAAPVQRGFPMAKAKKTKKTSKRGVAAGYRVFLLAKKGDDYSAKLVGKLAGGLTTAEVMAILKKMAPKKSTTAVAVTKTGTISLSARARKAGGKNKTSQKAARLAAKSSLRATRKRPIGSKKKTSKSKKR